jgi:hypothetical protein
VIILAEEYPQVDLSYQQDLEIDQHNLELEWVRQAKLMDRYSIIHAQAIFNNNRANDQIKDAEANLKKVFAELDGEARGPVLPEGLAKQVDAAVKEWAIRRPRYQQAQNELAAARAKAAEAQYVVDVMFGAVMAFQAKKVGLENLVRLFGMKYYAEPYDAGSEIKSKAMEQGRLAAIEAMRKLPIDGNTPKVSVNLGPAPVKTPVPDRDKDGYRYAIGIVQAPFQGVFTFGPFPELQQALDCIPGEFPAGIYRLTKEQPDELIYVWRDEWIQYTGDVKPLPYACSASEAKPTSMPPRPPQRPLPKAK